MSKKVIVLGAGIVGSAMAIDLSRDFDVFSVDIDPQALEKLSAVGIRTQQADLRSAETVQALVADYDLAIGAVPGWMGYATLQAVIEAGKNIVDISFFAEDPFSLHDLALQHNVTAITDCGVAPGMGNIILGYHNAHMQVQDYRCYVGGLPVTREWPFEYKAVFSPIDVIEEYIRPARYVLNGQEVVREALSEAELMPFDGVGTLEAWNSDGLRTLIRTMQIPNMIEKTLRYPGTIEYLRVLREIGLFSYDAVEVNGAPIRPIDLTAKLLFPRWKMQPGDEDITVMKISISGTANGQAKTVTYDLFDRYDAATDTISMARTTGYTATAAAHLVLGGQFQRKGICPPEYLGEEEANFRAILAYLDARGVQYQVSEGA